MDDDRRRVQRARDATCVWCGGPIDVRSKGPVPKWCSSSCRHRAWEQRRAAASGLAAVEVVERPVEVLIERTVQSVTEVPREPRGREWADHLQLLARRLDTGRIYDRDLNAIAEQLRAAVDSMSRRLTHQRRRR